MAQTPNNFSPKKRRKKKLKAQKMLPDCLYAIAAKELKYANKWPRQNKKIQR